MFMYLADAGMLVVIEKYQKVRLRQAAGWVRPAGTSRVQQSSGDSLHVRNVSASEYETYLHIEEQTSTKETLCVLPDRCGSQA